MLFRRCLLPGLLAGALPLAGFAQTEAPAAPKPRLFVGLGVLAGAYQVPNNFGAYVASFMPTVGVQLRPRLAVQASAVYYQESHEYFYPGRQYINGKLQDGISVGSSQQRTAAVPVLVRYALSRRPERRFQVDLLSGFAVVHSTFRSANTVTDSTRAIVFSDDYRTANSGFQFLLGPGLRYRLGRHLDLTGDYVFSALLNNPHTSYHLAATAAAGLRYRFGRS